MTQNPQVDRSKLMDVLWSVQKKKGCILHDDITKIAQEFNMSRMELEGVVTFYHFYHRTHSGRYTIYLNDSIVSEHSGRPDVLAAFEEAIGTKLGSISADGKFGLFKTACIGLSDQEPSCLINFKPFTNLTPAKVYSIISKLREGAHTIDICDTPETNIRYTPAPERTVFFKPYQKFWSLSRLKEYEPYQILELVKRSKLTGRGGAFFPTGLKWQFCRQNRAEPKYLICNADEGEPGTFKDRVLLQEHPELLIEGMILGAYAIGATKGAIYLRAEYMYLKHALQDLLQEYRDKGFLGEKIDALEDFSFDIYIHTGAGAYVCGEETALIHSMEGKRGEPGTREYFPVDRGFNDKPTVVNNVETLCAVPRILEMGIEKYLELGTDQTPGTKLLSVSGDCEKPGLYEIEWGMKLKDFLKLVGTKDPYFVIFNGYAGETLSKIDFEREISGENLLAETNNFNLIIEDEKPASRRLVRIIGQVEPGADILGVIPSVEKATNWLLKNPPPDVIFMDIQLEDGLCFEIFEQCDIQTPVIFTTAFDEYTLKAFKVNSIDYLLKPIDEEELGDAIQKYKQLHKSDDDSGISSGSIDQVLKLLSSQYKSRFVVRVGERIRSIPVEEIQCFYSMEKANYIQTTADRHYTIDYSLEQVESLIDPQMFFRVNRKYIVALDAIKEIISHSNSRLRVVLFHKTEGDIIVAREKVKPFKLWLER